MPDTVAIPLSRCAHPCVTCRTTGCLDDADYCCHVPMTVCRLHFDGDSSWAELEPSYTTLAEFARFRCCQIGDDWRAEMPSGDVADDDWLRLVHEAGCTSKTLAPLRSAIATALATGELAIFRAYKNGNFRPKTKPRSGSGWRPKNPPLAQLPAPREPSDSKRCTACGDVKPNGQFSRSSSTKSGLGSKCRRCKADYMGAYNRRRRRQSDIALTPVASTVRCAAPR